MREVEALLDRDFHGPARRRGTLGGVHGGGVRGGARLAEGTLIANPCFGNLLRNKYIPVSPT